MLLRIFFYKKMSNYGNITKNMRSYHFFAVAFSMIAGILGLIISYYYNIPTGPMIVIISGIIYFITFALKGKIKE